MLCNHHKDARQDCSCVETFEAIANGEDLPKLAGYCAIVREAAKHPDLLAHYASDLITHDRADLTAYDGPFLWVLRECGTVLLKPMARDNWRAYDGRLTVKGILNAVGWTGMSDRPAQRWYWWDGRTLRHVTSVEEAERLVHDAEDDMVPSCATCGFENPHEDHGHLCPQRVSR
jgi:hypothetical protein